MKLTNNLVALALILTAGAAMAEGAASPMPGPGGAIVTTPTAMPDNPTNQVGDRGKGRAQPAAVNAGFQCGQAIEPNC